MFRRSPVPGRCSPPAAGLVLLVAVSLTSGCGGIFGGETLRPTIKAVKADETRAFNVSAGPGFVRFEGHITTAVECQEIRATLDQYSSSNGEIDLVVEARALEGCPNQQQTTWNYIGNLQSVEPGDYTVTVTHRFENQDLPTEEVVQGQVTVSPR